jgi:DNA-damage-inducible protein J
MGYNFFKGDTGMAATKKASKKMARSGSYQVAGPTFGGTVVPPSGKVVGKVARKRAPSMSGMIRARVDPELKARAETILGSVGLNASVAIRLFYSQVVLSRGLPFEVRIPNAETLKVLRDADAGKGLTRFESVDGLFRDLES